ncbi:MAG: hypothetical protein ABWX84_04820 [Nocardioides sp.]
MPGRLLCLLLGVVLLTSVTGCSSDSAGDSEEPAPRVEMSFSQHRIDEGSDRANLRVVNDSDRPAQVTEIGLDSAGYGEHVEDHDSLVQPGQTIDLRMTLPEPVCDASPTPAYGIVTIAGTRIREKLDTFGQDFVESLWRRTCNLLSVTTVADLAWRFDYEAVGTGRASYLRGVLGVTRKPGATTPLRVVGMQGSVLFRLQQTARPTLGPDDEQASVPLRLRWGRCDEHAISESSQTFLWKLDISVDGKEPVRITTTVDESDRAPLLDYLKKACGLTS